MVRSNFNIISLLFQLETTVAAALQRNCELCVQKPCRTLEPALRLSSPANTAMRPCSTTASSRTKLSTYSHGLHRRHGWYDLELQVRKLVAEGHADAV